MPTIWVPQLIGNAMLGALAIDITAETPQLLAAAGICLADTAKLRHAA
jgi:hypothetical protein